MTKVRHRKLKRLINVRRCDWPGCKNRPYREVYPIAADGELLGYWSYLCKEHFHRAQAEGKKFVACRVDGVDD